MSKDKPTSNGKQLIKHIIKKDIKPTQPIEPEIIAPDESGSMTSLEALQMILQGSDQKLGMNDDDMKDVEVTKLLLSAMVNDDLLESLTNLNDDELDDIRDALYINEYADNPRLGGYISHTLKLSRSRIADNHFSNMLQIFSDMAGKGMRLLGNIEDKNTLGNRFRRN